MNVEKIDHWSYRLIKKAFPINDKIFYRYDIYECYFNIAGEIIGMDSFPAIFGDDLSEDDNQAIKETSLGLVNALKDIQTHEILDFDETIKEMEKRNEN